MAARFSLPPGGFTTTIGGKRCTALPRNANSSEIVSSTTASSLSISSPPFQSTTAIESSTSLPESTSSSTSTSPSPPAVLPIESEATSSVAGDATTTIPEQTPSSQSMLPSAIAVSTDAQAQTGSASLAPAFGGSLRGGPDAPLETTQPVPISSPVSDKPPLDFLAPSLPEPPAETQGQTQASQTDSNTATASTAEIEPAPITATSSNPASSSGQQASTDNAIVLPTSSAATPPLRTGNHNSRLPSSSGDGQSSGAATQMPAAIAGGVVGGLALAGLAAFLVWFWRKRRRDKRRSTLLTPLSISPTSEMRDGQRELGNGSRNIFNTNGPSAAIARTQSAIHGRYHRLRGRFDNVATHSPGPSVDLDRGTSQFGPLSASASYSNRIGPGEALNDIPATKPDERAGWLGRFGARVGSKRRAGGASNDRLLPTRRSVSFGASSIQASGNHAPKGAGLTGSIFTGAAGARGQLEDNQYTARRRSRSAGSELFLSGLGFDENDDSLSDGKELFADPNTMAHESARPPPLATTRSVGPTHPTRDYDHNALDDDPFSDANAHQKHQARPRPQPQAKSAVRTHARRSSTTVPATYLRSIGRSRSRSRDGSHGGSWPPSPVADHGQRGSGRQRYVSGASGTSSVESFYTRRNKVRSDPFDLDRPELLRGSGETRGGSEPSVPDHALLHQPQHRRADSYTSKISSGVSTSIMDGWSDPGPDVGQAARSGPEKWSVGQAL